jgi:hypothetical protein
VGVHTRWDFDNERININLLYFYCTIPYRPAYDFCLTVAAARCNNKCMKNNQATILTPKEATERKTPLPASWKKAAGLLKNKKVDAMKYQKQIRKEWDERTENLHKLVWGNGN